MMADVRERCPGVPIVLVSGLDAQDTIEILTEEGAVSFVPKPFSLMTLATAVRDALDGAPNN